MWISADLGAVSTIFSSPVSDPPKNELHGVSAGSCSEQRLFELGADRKFLKRREYDDLDGALICMCFSF